MSIYPLSACWLSCDLAVWILLYANINRSRSIYRGIERWPLKFKGSTDYGNKLIGKIAILVDDRIATSATINIAISHKIKQKRSCKKLIVILTRRIS